ncbi:MAG: shikimate dehydrogenase [Oscillospiraceae bacterium]|nr:shikimate dehydrogenase [Oscillospiraceae bacterium]
MKRFAILGYPLGHTMSPPIHQRLFELSGQQAEYEVLQTPPEQFGGLWPYLRQLDGFNITIPYKQQIIPFCARLDETAQRYGAVNVVDCRDGGTGYNTDCVGFLHSLEGIPLSGEVLIAGAGGVGRMFAIEAARQGAAVTLAVRPSGLEKARHLQAEMAQAVPNAAPVRVTTLESLPEQNGRYRWLINATPVGMYPNVEDLPLDPAVLPRCENLFEAIYNPVQTKLMRLARQAGCHVIGGMAMLVWQAVQAHQNWYGAAYRDEDIAALIREMEAQLEAGK